ncbi:MAG: serine--tRNA ligase [Acidimicrobiia bacterium]
MIDPRFLRDNPDLIRRSLARRGADIDLDAIISLEEEARAAQTEAEQARAAQREAGKDIARLEGPAKESAIASVQELADRVKTLTARADELRSEFDQVWLTVPNLVDDTAAEGLHEGEGEVLREVGERPEFDFEPLDYAAIGEDLDIIDTVRAAKVSGSRFGYLKGQAVLLEFALVRWALDHMVAAGHTPMVPPVLVREEALVGTGFFPADREQVYAVEADDLYLVGTSEVPLAAYHADEIFETGDLPARYAGFSTCFRREAGTYGKDTTGIFRVHQFDKVEMFVFCLPGDSPNEHDRLLELEESLVRQLEVPYRVVNIPAGDLGASAAKKYDIEAWFPSQGRYREITSCSNTTDYQARRLQVRYRAESGNETIHTLNGTACAIGRTILTLLENHQQEDGSVLVPEALRPYTGFDRLGAA